MSPEQTPLLGDCADNKCCLAFCASVASLMLGLMEELVGQTKGIGHVYTHEQLIPSMRIIPHGGCDGGTIYNHMHINLVS